MKCPTNYDKIDYLLGELPRRGPEAFNIFIKALVMTYQDHLARLLEPEMAESHISERQKRRNGDPDNIQPAVPPPTPPELPRNHPRPATPTHSNSVAKVPESFPSPQYPTTMNRKADVEGLEGKHIQANLNSSNLYSLNHPNTSNWPRTPNIISIL